MSAAPVPTSRTRQGLAVARQGIDRRRREAGATEPPIDPREVAQVAAQGRGIVQWPIQQFLGIDRAAHGRASLAPRGDLPGAALDQTGSAPPV